MSRGRGKYNAQRQYRPYRAEHLDPDNWAEIPEFGVLPHAPAYEGFALPLSSVKDREAAESMRMMLRIARKKIRGDFAKRAAIVEIALNGANLVPGEQTDQHRSAMAFRSVEGAIANAANPNTPERFRFGWIAHAGAVLAAWQSGDKGAIMQTLARSIGKLGGQRSGEVRRKAAIDRVAVHAAAKENGWPDQRYGVQKKLAAEFGCTASHIGEILREK